MAIRQNVERLSRPVMTKDNFRDWLLQSISNEENRIGKAELRKALRALGINNSFTSWKAGRALRRCDFNGDGYIQSDEEINALIDYAARNWGLMVLQSTATSDANGM